MHNYTLDIEPLQETDKGYWAVVAKLTCSDGCVFRHAARTRIQREWYEGVPSPMGDIVVFEPDFRLPLDQEQFRTKRAMERFEVEAKEKLEFWAEHQAKKRAEDVARRAGAAVTVRHEREDQA